MILYTVLDLEEVLEGFEEAPQPTLELSVGGVFVEAEPLGSFQARVVRVLSTDPRHFLEPHCQPGAIIQGVIV
ncbi:MAG TPA: hypothetical protein GX393_02625 [Firmicutes bacterium]|nr:hypothetical protein [Bacillota bacterium]